ncbi:MAG: hypothetical protein HY958_12380 [Bacteroidia bacterium]|nr:hypothetical protein [Bacteroidia bacterium]
MKNIVWVLLLCMIKPVFAQNNSFKINFDDCLISQIAVKGIENPEKAKYICNTLHRLPDVVFCYTSLSDGIVYVIADKNYDLKQSVRKINEIGFEIVDINSAIFNDETFLNLYAKITKSVSDNIPNHIKTTFATRDDVVYTKAKEIWVKKNPEKYNALQKKSEITDEQKKEKEAKDKLIK